ncbi:MULTISPECIES: polysaccharide deacetylase family protein [Lysinibacillus]|uniref:polysaccharide deacetylase family protein n=1 Tax=Lysinibacillus TaxID=400634 RepID=UPI000568D28E|nr:MULTISPECIES: polysaccharide deacetylase family protein [Lysinibacillus]SCY35345.1 Peptidoglycan/xylan/chitin deacetylase, PgdA/CDA1 family [Lysinibacillus sp. SG9]SDB18045.1 Peptidoglycan/xylan/chitin deacetylase, PgdA/CDA1 family [Lysinibacillus sp. TC-37]SFS65713.1 Peptidoglycan/xylan/chitin deacetylase, PgdA/CDA1 family [Lysinibacillus sp. SG55]
MTKFLPYAIVLTLMMCLFAGQLSASAEGPVVIQKVMKDTVIYEKPSKTSNEMGELAKGHFVTVTQASKGWTHIQTPEQVGFVPSDVLVKLKSVGYLVIQKGGATLFTAPSQNAQQAGSLYEGRMIYVYGTAPGGWSFVQYGQDIGYVATNALKKPVPTKKRINAVAGAELRLTASPHGEVLGTLANNTAVQYYITLAGWAYVEAGDQKGYVKASELANIQLTDNKVYNKGVPVVKGAKKRVALTFDDGPNAKVTPQILATLNKYDAKATFFMVGKNVSRNAAIVKQVYEAGHEIGNHTLNHKKLTALSIAEVKQEVNGTSNAIYTAIGQYPTVFRPPYGATNDQVRSFMTIPSILWSIDTLDWKHHNADKILAYVKASVKDGSIILMHDIHQTTANGLENVILYLQKQGYEFVTVSEILQ